MKETTVNLQPCLVCESTHVIVSEIPDSYATKAEGLKGEVDLALARRQHAAYVETLRSAGVNVKVLPADEAFPDCVFVEDAAVIIGGHALITVPGIASRAKETKRMRTLLRDEFRLPILEITDKEAKLDGGDVLFTGREILVGLSVRTNERGVKAIQEAFPGFTVTPIQVSGPLHLKTLLTLVGPDTLCASTETGDSVAMLDRIDKASKFQYKRVLVPKDLSANGIFINGTLICKSEKEDPESFRILKQQLGQSCKIRGVELSEMEKAVGSLTCMSLRFKVPSSIRSGGQTKLVCRLESVEN